MSGELPTQVDADQWGQPGLSSAATASRRSGPFVPRNYDSLPVEQSSRVPNEIIAVFEHITDSGGEDKFNDLGRHFPRDKNNIVRNNTELIERVNEYTLLDRALNQICFRVKVVFTCGLAHIWARHNAPAGNFGHYTSAGRHMLTKPGENSLTSTDEAWAEDIPMDDEENPRDLGTKILVTVPENYVGGAFRIGGQKQGEKVAADDDGDKEQDGEFVLLGQGRHVLDSAFYREVKTEKLDKDRVRVGPVTVLYVKEGRIGGAYERATGTYRILQPGPPYLLHEKDFETITIVERTMKPFQVGPITFVTVKDGEMAGAYNKNKGTYQLLPPGHTYKLHSKDWEDMSLVARTNQFELGPFTFVTVQDGFLCGAYKKKGGEFMMLPPGATYQLNQEEFDSPIIVKRDKHVVTVGPKTFVTLQEGVLTGAFRVSDGHFQEFTVADGVDGELVLHEEEYHDIVNVPQYCREVEDFGPNKIITIGEGECGVFEREGQLEIKNPGFYKVPAEYRIKRNINLRIRSEQFTRLEFRTKDSVTMIISCVAVWKVSDARQVASWSGTQEELRETLRTKAESEVVMQLRTYNRNQLMPTRQDVMKSRGIADEEALANLMRVAQDRAEEVLRTTEESTLESLNESSDNGKWGVEVSSVKIDSLELGDDTIIRDLQHIAQQMLATKRKQVEGRAKVQMANLEREAAIQQARAYAEVEQTRAASEANMQKARARSSADVEEQQATAKNEVALLQATSSATAAAEAKKIELEMQRSIAQAEADIEDTMLRAKQREAEIEANSIMALTEANYQKGIKEQGVASQMPEQELELARLRLVVDGMRHYGQAQWRHPDQMHMFFEQMKPFLRLSPMTGQQLDQVVKGQKSSGYDMAP